MLKLTNITKEYVVGENKLKALNDVSVSFRENEFVSILGQSGSGKTTMLNIIGGLDQYTSGDLIINGVSTKKYKDSDWDYYRNNSIGFVFQSYNLIPHQSVLANVELALTLAGVSKKERQKRAIEALEQVGLKDHIYKKPNQMSGGQMQRVAIARALINNPDILLADEPTGALDSETSVQIMGLLKEIAKDKLVIMVTHNPELADEYSTRIIRLKDGKIIGDSDPVPDEEMNAVTEKKKHKISMSFKTALSLSFNNLRTKLGRTILTSFAGSIGIIGISLILSLSAGFHNYINDIQEDALTSYPLTLQQDTADATSMLLSMVSGEGEDLEGTKVLEKKYISSMFASVGKNDLKSFIEYLDNNKETVDELVTLIDYTYSVSPNIYTKLDNGEYLKLNPSDFMSSLMGTSSPTASLMTSTMSIFSEMNDEEALKSNVKILTGRWPEKYNEVLLMLPNEHEISDLLAYGIGLRDLDELKTMISDIIAGKSVEDTSEPLELSYEELMNLEFKLIDATSTYRYNSKYKIYEDMSTDEDFMKDVYNNSENIKIVGIVCQEGSSMSMSSGILYKKELTEYVIEKANESEIVKKQLQNRDVNVFSNKRFDEEDDEAGLNFEDMISIDTDMLSSAFGMDINESDISSMTQGYMGEISNAITTDVTPAKEAFENAFKTIAKGALVSYLANPQEDINAFVETYFASQTVTDTLNSLTGYVVPSDTYVTIFKPMVLGLIQNTAAIPGFSEAMADMAINAMMQDATMQGVISQMSTGMTEAKMKSDILTKVGALTQELMGSIAGAFNVDTNKIAGAFTFNLSEEELSRLMTTMSSSSVEQNADTNLLTLGYQELDKPTMMSFYFQNFENKELFEDFIAEYNEAMEETDEDKVINYTDITGILMSSVKTIVDSVTYVLIAFVSISLIVSSIMIGIITYISVLERTKEIGILRAIGASKKDISRVFNAETVIVGLTAGLIGIGTTLLLIIPINMVIEHLTDIADLAFLPPYAGIILIIISVVLTMIAGLIPSRVASKKDPVEALRTE